MVEPFSVWLATEIEPGTFSSPDDFPGGVVVALAGRDERAAGWRQHATDGRGADAGAVDRRAVLGLVGYGNRTRYVFFALFPKGSTPFRALGIHQRIEHARGTSGIG